jgi:hypothetical protein
MLPHDTVSVNSSAPPASLHTDDGSPDVTCVEARPRPSDRLCLSAVPAPVIKRGIERQHPVEQGNAPDDGSWPKYAVTAMGLSAIYCGPTAIADLTHLGSAVRTP